MDIFFTQKFKYTVNDSIENVLDNIKAITEKKWYDFSKNITGSLQKDYSFKFTHKWSFAIIHWLETDPAYLTGKISQADNKAIITASLRPNSGFVLIFYLLAILFLCEVFGVNTFTGSKTFKLLFFPFFSLIILVIMRIFTKGLRNRFERLMHL